MSLIETDDLKIVKLEIQDTAPVTRVEVVRYVDNLEKQFNARLDEKDNAIKLVQTANDKELSNVKAYFEAKLAEKEKAIELLQHQANQQPPVKEVAAAVQGVEKLLTERINGQTSILEAKMDGNTRATDSKFSSIDKQFVDLDTRTERNAALAKEAVANALQAQKESVGSQNEAIAASNDKMENSFTKQIDQQANLINSVEKSGQNASNDLKDRIQSLDNRVRQIEGRKEGTVERTDQSQKSNTLVVAVIASIIGGLGVITGLVMAVFAIFHH